MERSYSPAAIAGDEPLADARAAHRLHGGRALVGYVGSKGHGQNGAGGARANSGRPGRFASARVLHRQRNGLVECDTLQNDVGTIPAKQTAPAIDPVVARYVWRRLEQAAP